MKMKRLILLYVLLGAMTSSAGVIFTATGIFVEGAIEGDAALPHPFGGDTIDYLTFEVTTTGPVRLIATGIGSSTFLAMGQVVGGSEPFDIVIPPYLLFYNRSPIPPEFTHILDPGIYLVQIAQEEYEDGDLGYGFFPVNRSGGGFFIPSLYSFALEGQFQVLDFMEGNLDGTFTVTHVPEPSVIALLLPALAAGFIGRRRK